MALLGHADEILECLFIEAERKWAARGPTALMTQLGQRRSFGPSHKIVSASTKRAALLIGQWEC